MSNRHDLPDAFTRLDGLGAELSGRVLYVFLDYDGTLTPICARPEDAVFDPAMRARVARLAGRHRTAVISGRGLDDLVPRVGVEGIFHAGSHGIELRHPDGTEEQQPAAVAAADQLGPLARFLRQRLDGVPGLHFETKRFGVAVHFRTAPAEAEPLVEAAIAEARTTFAGLMLKAGKKVFELVPALDWDKGKAVGWIIERAGLAPSNVLPLYIGDDLTDEDAFRAINGHGLAIAVGDDGPARTAATLRLADIDAVGRFLEALLTV